MSQWMCSISDLVSIYITSIYIQHYILVNCLQLGPYFEKCWNISLKQNSFSSNVESSSSAPTWTCFISSPMFFCEFLFYFWSRLNKFMFPRLELNCSSATLWGFYSPPGPMSTGFVCSTLCTTSHATNSTCSCRQLNGKPHRSQTPEQNIKHQFLFFF